MTCWPSLQPLIEAFFVIPAGNAGPTEASRRFFGAAILAQELDLTPGCACDCKVAVPLNTLRGKCNKSLLLDESWPPAVKDPTSQAELA